MNPVVFALRRPITVMVAVLAVAITCFFAIRPKAIDQSLAKVGIELPLKRMAVDIFPALNLPVIYVCQPYGGMDPAQMEGLLTNYYEYHFLYISGIHHVESRNVQGVDAGHLVSMAGAAKEPLFVVVSTGTMRIFVDVPEVDAVLLQPGAEAQLRVASLGSEEFPGVVSRTT